MSSSNRYKSHSEGSDRHIHEPPQTVLNGLQGKRLGNVATNQLSSDELVEHPETFLKQDKTLAYYNEWNSLSCKTQIKKIKDWHNQRGEESKEEAEVASTSKPQARKPP
ncbi:hypothetical protein O181_112800 [Austropuccinia psidii MF-1]|uniref:Uncharacterized protein n=1 Tax=Austropuccinia psidii MF-1 TaxID=1389203 RepID=A0A9Q3K548_9BASI|nr:hypothetical protein [Austropuccinia psidii MF-1]